jgi:hypothetical protein
MIFNIVTAFLALSVDLHFHEWCTSVGIETPLASLRTMDESVAGEKIVQNERNGASNFPEVAESLSRQKR